MSEKLSDQEWSLPVLDSDVSISSETPGIGSTGAWASYAIGAVTKNLLKGDSNKKFPFIEEAEHPVHLSALSEEPSVD